MTRLTIRIEGGLLLGLVVLLPVIPSGVSR
jgi:hypothetical protein